MCFFFFGLSSPHHPPPLSLFLTIFLHSNCFTICAHFGRTFFCVPFFALCYYSFVPLQKHFFLHHVYCVFFFLFTLLCLSFRLFLCYIINLRFLSHFPLHCLRCLVYNIFHIQKKNVFFFWPQNATIVVCYVEMQPR